MFMANPRVLTVHNVTEYPGDERTRTEIDVNRHIAKCNHSKTERVMK